MSYFIHYNVYTKYNEKYSCVKIFFFFFNTRIFLSHAIIIQYLTNNIKQLFIKYIDKIYFMIFLTINYW